MKVAIIGAGAMGSLYGGVLAENQNQVWFVDVYKPHVDAINEHGLIINKEGKQRSIKGIKAVTDSTGLDAMDLLILFVKSTSTKEAIKENLNLIGDETSVLTLQNGLGNIESLAQFVQKDRIIAGTSSNGANMVNPGEINHAGWGGTTIGELNGEHSSRIKKVRKLLGTGELGPAQISDNVIRLVWDKLIANVGINPITAISRLRNGEILEYPYLVNLLEKLIFEAVAVANAKGIHLDSEKSVHHCKEIARATKSNVSSMLADIMNQRKTEIDNINGAIVSEGISMGISTPMNALVTDFIKALERSINKGD